MTTTGRDQTNADRAVAAYRAMQRRFHARGRALYRRDGLLRRPGAAAHLWPFARALVATLDLSGVPPHLLRDFDARHEIADRLSALERYWDAAANPPAYHSDVVTWTGRRSDRYHDDNAWVGLALVQHHRMLSDEDSLRRAEQLFDFAVSGWDARQDAPRPGGVFWIEQGRGTGLANHDRNTVSTATNAELGLHLEELAPAGGRRGTRTRIGASEMYEWVNASLDAGGDATGLYWDKVRGDGTLDKTLWSYNQGSMVGANVLLHRRAPRGDATYLRRAEAIARKALELYSGPGYLRQPAAFNAIFFRNLLLLHAATSEDRLRATIIDAMRTYADTVWTGHRSRGNLFRLAGRAATLLDQSAMVQTFALLAWDPADYAKLA